ncbi:hypothetical protein NDU88_001042 [Pleurodeles waltl]|uniref:Uncharacterized protein n=1 Tax=Pleurodeles waltl TaxID=8319 RepID=A0AAV7Q4M7_PLEWA|nr:hypothetical protein NDU88_001042 [Pleurodeles waltl]
MGHNKTTRTPACLLDSGAPLTQAEGRNGSSPRDCVSPTNSPPPADKLDLILQEIRESRAATEHRIDTIPADLGILKDDHNKLATKLRTAEVTLAELAPQHARNTETIFDLQRWIQQLQNRAEDAKGRSRQNNVRIIGISEREEGTNPT